MKKFASLIIALAMTFSFMLTGCSGSVKIPDTDIELSIDMSEDDLDKIWDSIQQGSSDSDKDDEETTAGSVTIKDVTVSKKNKTTLQVDFTCTMSSNIDYDDYEDAAAEAAEVVLRRLGLSVRDVKSVSMNKKSSSRKVYVTLLIKR